MFDSLCISAGASVKRIFSMVAERLGPLLWVWTAGALAGAGPVPQVGVVKTRHVLAWLGFLFGGSGLELVTFGVLGVGVGFS